MQAVKCPDCWGTGVDVYRELCGTCGGRVTWPGPHERYALRMARLAIACGEFGAAHAQCEIAANEARERDRSDTALVMRRRRMVQP